MLVIPEYLKPLVSDYRMNLIQVRQSESLCFRNQDISIVFDVIRSIYNKDYETFHEMYKDKTMSTELGLGRNGSSVHCLQQNSMYKFHFSGKDYTQR